MVKVDIDFKRPYQMLSLKNVQRGKSAMSNQALADMNPFVPMREGTLRTTGHVTSDANEIVWNTPYAKRLFYNQFYNYTTPGTGPRWDLKAEGMFLSDWQRAFMRGAEW